MATAASLRIVAPARMDAPSLAFLNGRSMPSSSSHCQPGILAGLPRSTQSRVALNSGSFLRSTSFSSPAASLGFLSSTITANHLRGIEGVVAPAGSARGGGALGAVCELPVTPEHLRWVTVAASAALMYLKSSGVQAQLLIPLLAVEAPRKALGWLQGDYGLWVAFLALAVKVVGYLPAVLELPLYLILLIITGPAQLTQYRGTPAASGVSLAIAAYLGFQHYKKSDGVKGAFKGESLFPSIAIILLAIIPIVFLVNGTSA